MMVGIDESGTGALAGPYTVAAVAWPDGIEGRRIRDSKKIRPGQHMRVAQEIVEKATWVLCVVVDIEAIRLHNIGPTWNAAVDQLLFSIPGHLGAPEVVVDGNKPILFPNARAEEKADAKYPAVSAASIVAKAVRDDIMKRHPLAADYGWDTSAGYGTKVHDQALLSLGLTDYHRPAANTRLANLRRRDRRGH